MENGSKEINLNICYSCMRKLKEGVSVCPSCGHDSSVRQNPEDLLPEGTVLSRKYLVGRVLGRGGFGVTYVGYDLDLQLKVAIKEYYPMGFSMRSARSYDVISTTTQGESHTAFAKGCTAFLDEARTIAKFNSPYVVHVRDYFREHNTAYIVMDYVEGVTLREEMTRSGGRIDAERVVSLMKPLIRELYELHKRNIIHRDIKPDNIMLVNDRFGDHFVLLDFGAARTFLSNESKTLTGVVTHGFSPLEQYSQKSRQGAFTDVYALCATIYNAITGAVPPTAMERLSEEIPLAPFRSFGLNIPQNIDDALMHGLALKSADRTQTMQQLLEELEAEPVSETAISPKQEEQKADSKPELKPEPKPEPELKLPVPKPSRKGLWIGLVMLALIIAGGIGGYSYLNRDRGETEPDAGFVAVSVPEMTATPAPAPSASPVPKETPAPIQTPTPTPEPTLTSTPTSTPTLTPMPTSTPTLTPMPTSTPTPTPTPTPTSPPEPTPAPTPEPTPSPVVTASPEVVEKAALSAAPSSEAESAATPAPTQTPPPTPTPHLHIWEKANCTKPMTCSVCGETFGEAAGHSWKNATCTAPRTCSVCGITEGEPLEHTAVTDKAVEPTCTEDGLTEGQHCKVCGTVLIPQESVPALGHSWSDATCTKPMTCIRCGTTRGGAAGHSWKNATCTEPRTCTVCGITEGEPLEHTAETDKAVEPTCTEDGLTEGQHCKVCGTVLTPQESVPALGHSWEKATCTEPMTCTRCGETRGEAAGHSWKNATCTEPRTCTVCGITEGEPLGHSVETDKAVEPTCTETGLTEGQHCKVCGEVLTPQKSVSALGHNWAYATCTDPTS